MLKTQALGQESLKVSGGSGQTGEALHKCLQPANPTLVCGMDGAQDFSTINGKESLSIPQGRFPDYQGHAKGGVTFREAIEKEAFPLLKDKSLAHLFS